MPLERALRALGEREAELARVQRIGQIGGLEVDLREGGFRNRRSPEYLLVHGLPPSAANESHESWIARIHPEDRERVVDHFLSTVRGRGQEYEVEYRIVRPSDGATRWIMAKAEIERDEAGAALRLVGAHVDITARRQAEEQKDLVSRELSHRIANIFTVVSSLVQMSARLEPEAANFAGKLVERIGALHRAHRLVISAAEEREGTLADLIERLMMPYRNGDPTRISITGDDIEIGRAVVTPMALVLHELVTNAVKYGALSSAGGRLDISIADRDTEIDLRWCERDGPNVAGPPQGRGFGSVLVERAARAQLGAELTFDWQPSGLVLSAVIPKERLSS